jgi:hypothetical protein
MTAGFSLKEAAAIEGMPEPVVRKAIETRTLRPRVVSAGWAPRYQFDVRDMLYLKLVAGFPLILGKRDKAALHRLVGREERFADCWREKEGNFVIDPATYIVNRVVEVVGLSARL